MGMKVIILLNHYVPETNQYWARRSKILTTKKTKPWPVIK